MHWKKLHFWMLIIVVAVVIFGFDAAALAQNPGGGPGGGGGGGGSGGTGGQIFADAACALLTKVLTQDFGAMITVIAGSLAILASVTGSFRGAWALVFVSVGTFIFPGTVDLLFPGLC